MRTGLLLVLLCVLGASVRPCAAGQGGDTMLGFRYGSLFHEPAIEPAIRKSIVSVTHSSQNPVGSNYVNVDVFMSDRNDPASGAGSTGAQEIYVLYRGQLNFHRAFKARVKFWVVRDVSLTAGFDLNTKNTAFGPRKRVIVVGPTVNFNVPGGFLDVGVWVYKEWNHNSFGVNKNVAFNTTYMVNASWRVPVPTGRIPSVFKGFGNYVGSKGLDGALIETAPEVLMRTSWMFDIGAALASRRGRAFIGPGLEYWRHKFGNPTPIPSGSSTKPNITTSCPMIQMELHF